MFKRLVSRIERYTDHPLYPVLLGFLAGIDLFVVIIPTDVLLVSYVAIHPKRWWPTAIATALGSAIGAVVLALFIQKHGVSILDSIVPGMMTTHWFVKVNGMMKHYGALTVFLVSLSPFIQHPAVVLAALAPVPMISIFAYSLAARTIKYLIWAWFAKGAPGRIRQLRFRRRLNPE